MINKILRDNTIKKISKYLDKKVTIIIEQSIFDFSNDYAENNGTPFLLEDIYETKSNEIIKLLESKFLKLIIKKINNKDIEPKKIAYLKESDLIPIKESKIKEKKGSDLFECPKCGKRNVTIKEIQKRAADEPADQIITCLECGNVWSI